MRLAILFFIYGIWLLQQQAELPNFYWVWLAFLLVPALFAPLLARWKRAFNRYFALARHSRAGGNPAKTKAPRSGQNDDVVPLSREFFNQLDSRLRENDVIWPIGKSGFNQALLASIACAFGFFYAAGFAQQRLSEYLPTEWQGKDIAVIGVVAEMPRLHQRGLRFVFDVEQVLTPNAIVPSHIMLATYESARNDVPTLHAGERWQLTVRLKRPHGSSNPHGFDYEAWMLENNLRASGYVRPNADNLRLDLYVNKPSYLVEVMRENVRDSFQKTLINAPYAGVLTALAIGDQASIPASQWQVFTRTGVNHLMSISGLHITMLAGLAFALSYWLWRRSAWLSHRLPARKAAILAGLLVALGYALLAGYGVPAQRTVYMLATIAAALWLSRTIAPSQLLCAALLVVSLLDPWAVLSPGFWLSFGAVAIIFYATAHRLHRSSWLLEYGRVQWAISIGLIPLLLALFQQISLVSPLANAFAIPLVSLVVVPLTLLGALLPLDWILHLAHQVMALCMFALEWLNTLPEAVWVQHAPPAWSIVLGVVGVLWLLLPRGFPARWLGCLLILPMFFVAPASPPTGTLRLVIFDVGQGLSVVVQTLNHALLYDSGPDFSGEADSGNRILVPSLRAQGIAQLDGLMLTHDDSDHTGGAQSILQTMPVNWLSSSLAADHALLKLSSNTRRCTDGQTWEWDGIFFEVLHPSPESYADEKIRDNERSCVLKISSGKHSILLAADIEKGSERRLLQQYADKLPATLLVVPHHGSKTSSTAQFVEAVHPRYAVFTAGYRNRYGHPKQEVVERYRAIGSELLRSDEDGAIVVNMDQHNFSVERYRKTHTRYWHNRPSNATENIE